MKSNQACIMTSLFLCAIYIILYYAMLCSPELNHTALVPCYILLCYTLHLHMPCLQDPCAACLSLLVKPSSPLAAMMARFASGTILQVRVVWCGGDGVSGWNGERCTVLYYTALCIPSLGTYVDVVVVRWCNLVIDHILSLSLSHTFSHTQTHVKLI